MFMIGSHGVPKASFAPAMTSTTGFTFGNGSAGGMASGVWSPGSTAGFYPCVWTTPVNTDNFFVQCTLNSAPATTSAQTVTYQRSAGVLVRGNIGFTQQVWCGVDSAGCYILTATSGTGGTVTLRASTATAWASADVMRIEAVGNVYTVYRNGTSHVSWTDSGGVITIGSANRQGGLHEGDNNFTASCSLKTLTIGDL